MECVISFLYRNRARVFGTRYIFLIYNKLKRDIINNDETVTLGLSRRDDCVNDFFFP